MINHRKQAFPVFGPPGIYIYIYLRVALLWHSWKLYSASTNPKRGLVRLKKHTLHFGNFCIFWHPKRSILRPKNIPFFGISGIFDILNVWRTRVGKSYPFHAFFFWSSMCTAITLSALPPPPPLYFICLLIPYFWAFFCRSPLLILWYRFPYILVTFEQNFVGKLLRGRVLSWMGHMDPGGL